MESPPLSDSLRTFTPAPELVGDYFEWMSGPDPAVPSNQPFHFLTHLAQGEEEVYVAESDCVPNKVCDLIAEYITDTICRIDSDAMVDVRVMMKADLIVASGEVACSHPARSAIIHSDQFISTLNSSVREVLGEIFSLSNKASADSAPEASPIQPPVIRTQSSVATPAPSTIPPVSPQGSMTVLGGFDEIDTTTGDFDVLNSHVIIAITPGIFKAQRDIRGGRWTGRAGNGDRSGGELLALKVEQFMTEWLKKNGAIGGMKTGIGGITVEVLSFRSKIHRVSVAINAYKLGALVSNFLASEGFQELRSMVGDDVVFSIRNVNRSRTTGVSSDVLGKDWHHVARYGPVLAKLEAAHLVANKYCDACEVELEYSDSQRSSVSAGVVGVRVRSFGTVRDDRTDDDLRELVWERCSKLTPEDIKKVLFEGKTTKEFFMLGHGGSSCAANYIGITKTEP